MAEQAGPLISVVTPVLNGARFIEGCIENVANEGIEAVEHIIVDGGSTDGTAEKLKAALHRYRHLRLIFWPGSNQADSLNRAITVALGRVIATLNVDDFYSEGVLKEVLELFSNLQEPSFVVGNCRVLGCGDRVAYTSRPRNLRLGRLALCGLRKDCFPLNPSSYFYHRSLHARVGMYDVELDFSLDVDFVMRAISSAKVKYVNRDWGNFRLIPGTKTYQDYVTTSNGPVRVRPVILRHLRRLQCRERIPATLVYQLYFGGFKVWQWYKDLRLRSFRKQRCARNGHG